jgi:hypothetical protein
MNRKSLAIGFVLSGTLILGSPQADGRTTPSTISFSGTFVSTQIDTNGDGQKATFQSMGTKGTGGSGTIQGVNEIVFSGPTTCPNGNAGFGFTLLRQLNPAAPAQFVSRVNSTGDLIFSEQTTVTLCFDPVTSISFFSTTNNITGGTGGFEGATGTSECEGTTKTLFDDGAGNQFGEQSGTCTATITTP